MRNLAVLGGDATKGLTAETAEDRVVVGFASALQGIRRNRLLARILEPTFTAFSRMWKSVDFERYLVERMKLSLLAASHAAIRGYLGTLAVEHAARDSVEAATRTNNASSSDSASSEAGRASASAAAVASAARRWLCAANSSCIWRVMP